MKLTYKELEAKLHETEARLHETEARLQHTEELLKTALEKITQLEERLNRNSKNSSKPPSTDQKGNTPDADKKPPKKSRAGRARPLFPPDKIDRHVQCTQENCPHCNSLKIQPSGDSPEVLQQVELPEIRAIVTEFHLQKYYCKECGQKSTAQLPLGIPDSAFGPKLMGLLATLTGVLHVAKREAVQLIKDPSIAIGAKPHLSG